MPLSNLPSDDINILFTTIQDLHGKLNNITEYSVSYEDFDDASCSIAWFPSNI
jgi:hypothetical protein